MRRVGVRRAFAATITPRIHMNNSVIRAVILALAIIGALAVIAILGMFFMHGSMMDRMMGSMISDSFAAADPVRGAKAFQQCAACHSTAPGEHLTGPSLAHIWSAKAASQKDFVRYSEALKKSGVTWNEQTLAEWLANPAKLVPGTSMSFPGVKDAAVRDDLLAYLRAVAEGKAPAAAASRGGMMMGRSQRVNLKNADRGSQVVSLTRCRDTYALKTANGAVHKIWEFNLRLKTDSTDHGPLPGKPVVVGSGMMGDRSSVVFAAPAEISAFIKEACE
jgi:cytochrome c